MVHQESEIITRNGDIIEKLLNKLLNIIPYYEDNALLNIKKSINLMLNIYLSLLNIDTKI
jgi:hypothetical protein